jgi:hypothetical protein
VSFKAENRYINKRNSQLRKNILFQDSTPLPKRLRSWKSFKSVFNNENFYEYSFLKYHILVDVRYAFRHFNQNTYNERRDHLNGTLYDTLCDPLIVVKIDNHLDNTKKLTFYKPFRSQDDILHMLMFQATKGKDDIYRFKTIYEAGSLDKVDKIIRATDYSTIYFKYD